jgi:hypothetical protein
MYLVIVLGFPFIVLCSDQYIIYECRNFSGQSIASIHGTVLALAASVLSAPYDMPRYVLLSIETDHII